MNDQIIAEIEKLKDDGLGYKKIASQLKISKNTVASYFQRKNRFSPLVYCKNCGYKIINMNKTGRKKIYCSKKCRINYYRNNEKR